MSDDGRLFVNRLFLGQGLWELDPELVDAWITRGAAHHNLGQSEQALDDLGRHFPTAVAGYRKYVRSARPAVEMIFAAAAEQPGVTGLSRLGLAEATALVFVAPVFITALSAVLLKERVGWRRWSAIGGSTPTARR